MDEDDVAHVELLDEVAGLVVVRVRAEGHVADRHVEVLVGAVEVEDLRRVHDLLAQRALGALAREDDPVQRVLAPLVQQHLRQPRLQHARRAHDHARLVVSYFRPRLETLLRHRLHELEVQD